MKSLGKYNQLKARENVIDGKRGKRNKLKARQNVPMESARQQN